MKIQERKILRSISFTESQLDAYEELSKEEGGSLAEHVRSAFNDYLIIKGYMEEV